MTTTQLSEAVGDAVTLRSDIAAIRIVARYEPLAGPGAKIYPPTYAPPKSDPKGTPSSHLVETRFRNGEKISIVLLDAVQSQANRCEEALLAEARAGRIDLPYLNLALGPNPPGWMVADIPSLRAPHRWADAYFRDAVYPDGTKFAKSDLWNELRSANGTRARGFFAHVPTDLIFGFWDSHQGRGTRLSRSYSSEMVGMNPILGERGSVRADPLNLPKQKVIVGDDKTEWRLATDKEKGSIALADIGHGMVPNYVKDRGAAVEVIERVATINLVGLALLAFPSPDGARGAAADRAARTALAALALLGDRLAFGGSAVSLRSGCELVLVEERIEFVARGAVTKPLDLDVEGAREWAAHAIEAAKKAGLAWGKPVALQPSPNLQKLIDKAGTVADDVENAD